MIIVNQACYSGTMISYIIGDYWIMISAADSSHEAWTEEAWPPIQQPFQHWEFIYEGRTKYFLSNEQFFFQAYPGFIQSLGTLSYPESINSAFEKGISAEYYNGNSVGSHFSWPVMRYYSVAPDKIYL